jgi:glycine dehydrogenase subunit 1
MPENEPGPYPYIPNSTPEVTKAMLEAIGVEDISDLYREIPADLRLNRRLNLPEPFRSEHDLRKYIEGILSKNKTCEDYANFLGAGCYRHFVPAVCDEIGSRAEFLTAYAGATYSDHGKHQAWFEFQSLLGELVDMDVVGFPTYDWSAAASSALLMASRLTGRDEIIVPKNLNPERLAQMRNFCKAAAVIKEVDYSSGTGQMDLEDLKRRLSPDTAAVYFENPTYLGILEPWGQEIADMAHAAGALVIVGVDPITLGILAPPSSYGADIVCGDAQTLGNHLLCGGGLCGFIASGSDPKTMEEYPTLFETISRTASEGEWAFGWATTERTSYTRRDASKDFTGTSTGLLAIVAGVFLALMGPQGMREVGQAMLQRSHYVLKRLAAIKGVSVPVFDAPFVKEFVVNFDGSGRTVEQINEALLDRGVFGGKDISREFPELGQSALYCVTEVTSRGDIDRLVDGLGEALR